MVKRILIAGTLLLLPLGASAEKPAQYFGVSVGDYELEDEDNNLTETTNIGVKGGYRFSPFLAVELHAGSESGGASGALDEPNALYGGAFVRLDLPFERVNLYLLAGGAGVEYDVGTETESQSGAAGGVGIELYGSERTAITFEYMNYAEEAYEGVSVGLVHHFDWPRLRR